MSVDDSRIKGWQRLRAETDEPPWNEWPVWTLDEAEAALAKAVPWYVPGATDSIIAFFEAAVAAHVEAAIRDETRAPLEASEQRATQWGKENVRLHAQVSALMERIEEINNANELVNDLLRGSVAQVAALQAALTHATALLGINGPLPSAEVLARWRALQEESERRLAAYSQAKEERVQIGLRLKRAEAALERIAEAADGPDCDDTPHCEGHRRAVATADEALRALAGASQDGETDG